MMTEIIAVLLLHVTGNLANAGLSLLLMDVLMIAYVTHKANELADISTMALLRQILSLRLLIFDFYNRIVIRSRHAR